MTHSLAHAMHARLDSLVSLLTQRRDPSDATAALATAAAATVGQDAGAVDQGTLQPQGGGARVPGRWHESDACVNG